MDYFSEQFTQELADFANKKINYYVVSNKWSVYTPSAPERHVSNGKAIGLDAETIYMELLKNEAFFRISSLLSIELTRTNIDSLINIVPDLEKEQVWLFAWNWYIDYYELLTDKKTLKTDFYKDKHAVFMNVLERMLCVLPNKRITFMDALNIWDPERTKTEDQSEDDDASVSSHLPSVADSAIAVSPQCAPTSSVKRRLVLKGWGGHAARNKTRKNYGN